MAHKTDLFTPATKGLVAAFGGDLVLKVLGFAATFFTLQALDPFQYGLWQLLLSVAGAFGVVTLPGIASMLVAEVSREYGAGRKREGNGIAVRAAGLFVALSLVGGTSLAIAAPFIKELSGIDIVRIMQLMAIAVFALGVRQAYALALHSRLQFVHVQAMKTIDRLSYLVWIFVFLSVMGKGVDGVVYAYVLSNVTAIILYAPYVWTLYRQMLGNQSRDDWQPFIVSSWERGRWVIGTDIVNTVSGTLWPWIVGFFLGVEAVGLIGIVILLLGQVASFVPISYILRSVLPRTVESPERLREWLFRSMKFSLWGHVLSGVLAFGACAILFPWWLPQHVAALPLFAFLLLSLPLRGVATSAGEWFYATGKQHELFLVSAVPKMVMLAVLPLFVWSGGIVGYAFWYLLSTDLVLMARLRTIAQSLGTMPALSFFASLDGVDRDLMTRATGLVRAKITARFSR